MRRALLIVLILAVMVTPALARERRCKTVNSVDKENAEMGVGVDIVLHEDKLLDVDYSVVGEYKYDWQNVDHSAFVVVKVKLKDIINKFKKEE